VQHARDAGGIKVATVTQVHDRTHKRKYNITTKTPTSQEYQIYNTKIQIIHKTNSIRVRTRIQMGLRGLKINDGVQTLPRPSRKGNLANVVAPIPVKIGPTVAKKGGRKRKEKEEKQG
jgi:hypothetical protein